MFAGLSGASVELVRKEAQHLLVRKATLSKTAARAMLDEKVHSATVHTSDLNAALQQALAVLPLDDPSVRRYDGFLGTVTRLTELTNACLVQDAGAHCIIAQS